MDSKSIAQGVGGVASHATGYGIGQAIQARAFLTLGSYVGVRVPETQTLCFINVADAPTERCGCGRESCRVDRDLADLQAIEGIPGPEGDLLHFLIHASYRLGHKMCMGDLAEGAL